jgi:hypothetical protein
MAEMAKTLTLGSMGTSGKKYPIRQSGFVVGALLIYSPFTKSVNVSSTAIEMLAETAVWPVGLITFFRNGRVAGGIIPIVLFISVVQIQSALRRRSAEGSWLSGTTSLCQSEYGEMINAEDQEESS